MSSAIAARLDVVAALIGDDQGRVLIAQRPAGRHHAGLWEFPGGKIEPGETGLQALRRELDEELGIEVIDAVRLMTVVETRADADLHMQAWRVLDYRGTPRPRDAQAINWLLPEQLPLAAMPPADRPIAQALRLPRRYLITPDAASTPAPELHAGISQAIERGVRMIRLRCTNPHHRLSAAMVAECERRIVEGGASMMVDRLDFVHCRDISSGIHLRSYDLGVLSARPGHAETRLLASCHDADQLHAAWALGADAAVISPVAATASHPGVTGIGWPGFRVLLDRSRLPAYALGGMREADLAQCWTVGALGYAAISQLWAIDRR